MIAGLEGGGNLRSRDHGAQRQAVGDAFAEGHDVRLNALRLDGEHPAGSAKSRLDLVGDEQNVVPVEDFLDGAQVARRRHDDAALAHDGFDDESGHVAGGGAAEDVFEHLRTREAARVRFEMQCAAVAVRRGHKGHARHERAAATLASGQAGEAERREGATVKRAVQCDELGAAGELFCQPDRRLIRLSPAAAEKALLQPPGRYVGEKLGQVRGRRVRVEIGARVEDAFELCAGRGDDLAVTVAGAGDGDTGEGIYVLLSTRVHERGPVAAFDHERLHLAHKFGDYEISVFVKDVHDALLRNEE